MSLKEKKQKSNLEKRNMNSTHSKILMRDISAVTLSSGEYERYYKRFESMQNKNGAQLFQHGVQLCCQNTFVHKTFKDLYQKENDPKILRAAYEYCNNQHEPKTKNTTTINNIYIKNKVECSNPQRSKEYNKPQEAKDKIESTKIACPRNNFLRKISFFIMTFIIIGLFLYMSAIKNIKDKEIRIKELEINNQKKQDKYDKLSFEYNKIIKKLRTENDEY
ncbi:hypothetical protein F8M41_007112 [Gigaspora margarita]|uniref:Uncharacterized protein n=1 Tax=Gigaspora margarita TaxID=4874 RepID=A0A8H3X6T4_GIGMA|nr:hypothetical protein F8M41_007112 [Gigaspora margarita]